MIDNDPGSKPVRKRFIELCKQNKIDCNQLKRYAIENYFSLNALRNIFGEQIPDTVTKIVPNKKLSDQIGFDVKRSNGKIAMQMTLEDIKDTDLEAFFIKVQKILK